MRVGPLRDPLFFIGRDPMEAQHLAPFDQAPEGLDEARLIVENGQARRIAEIVAAPLRSLGFRLVRVKLSAAAAPVFRLWPSVPTGR